LSGRDLRRGSAIKELISAPEFKGSAAPVPGADHRQRAKTSASGQTLRSVLKPDGVQAVIEPAGGDSANFESEVEIIGEGTFLESGGITYGLAGKVTFKTVERGMLGPSRCRTCRGAQSSGIVTGGEGGSREPRD
jgi:hypothetical protein